MAIKFTASVVFAAAVLGCAAVGRAASPADDPNLVVKPFDVDHNGMLDAAEVTNAGRAKFVSINPDKDGTLNAKDAAKAGIDPKQFAAANPDKDGTLDAKEFMKVLDARFKAADADKSGTVDARELNSDAGKVLLGMMAAS